MWVLFFIVVGGDLSGCFTADLKRAEAKQANGGDDSESDRPKKSKWNGKSSGKSSSKSKENGKKSNGKGKR